MEKTDGLYDSMEITGVMPDGTILHYEVLGVFALESERQYMALHPWDHPDSSWVELVPFGEGKDGEVEFLEFQSEEEYQQVREAFLEMFQDDEEEGEENHE